MKRNLLSMNLQLFAEPGGSAGTGSQGNAGGNLPGGASGTQGGHPSPAYTYEQAEEIAQARAQKAEAEALKGYFQKQGMSEQEVTQAIADFREKQKNRRPDVAAIEAQRDEALKEIQQYKNEKILLGMKVRQEDLDYVAFKVSKLVTDKKDFQTAASEFLKENPRYMNQSTYRISTGAEGQQGGSAQTANEQVNEAIREAIRGKRG